MKKKIIFSSSSGSPAALFINNIKMLFGSDNIELIASKIASSCMNTEIRIEHALQGETLSLIGSNALCIRIAGSTLELTAENINIEEGFLILN